MRHRMTCVESKCDLCDIVNGKLVAGSVRNGCSSRRSTEWLNDTYSFEMSYGPSGCPWARCRQTRRMEVVRAQDLAVLRLRGSTSDPVICTRGIRYGPSIVLPLSLYESETSIIWAGNMRCFQKSGVFRSSLLIVRKHSMSLTDTRGGFERRCARWSTCWCV